jgi:NAD(P)-dependent dehydrogenase (short-subunit alcohol dehydrogenase family)
MSNYLITGTSRGIGLELTKQLSQLDASQVSKIFAVTRGIPPKELVDLAASSGRRVVHVKCDVTDQKSMEDAVVTLTTSLAGEGLDVLVNNAGVCLRPPMDRSLINYFQEQESFDLDGVGSTPVEKLQASFTKNVWSVQRVTSAFLPLLRKGKAKKIINM